MRMAECIGLALMTLLELRNHQDGLGELARVATNITLLEKCSSRVRENQQKICWFPMRVRNT